MSKIPPAYGLIACDVFAEELPVLADRVASETGLPDSPWRRIAWLEMGLHDHPDRLRAQVQALIDAWDSAPDFSTILLAYGMCGNGLLGVCARQKTLVLPRAHDCISILLGGRAAHEAVLKENPGTYFYSPGWIRGRRVPGPDREPYLREIYGQRYPDDEEMVEDLVEADAMAFLHHNCAAYVDITENAEAENYCRDCARHLQWNFRKLPGEAGLLHRFLAGDWSVEDFLVVPPGHRIEHSADEDLIQAQAS